MNVITPTNPQVVEDQLKALALELSGREIEFVVMVDDSTDPAQEMERQLLLGEVTAELECLLRHEDNSDMLTNYATKSIQTFCGRFVEDNHIVLRDFAGTRIQIKAFGTLEDDCFRLYIRAQSTDYTSCFLTIETTDLVLNLTVLDMIAGAKENINA